MWTLERIEVTVSDVDGDVMLVSISTPVGCVEILGRVAVIDGLLIVEAAHVQGLTPGALGRAGLNAIARKLMREADAHGIVVEGSTRTTGGTRGRKQRPFRYPRQALA